MVKRGWLETKSAISSGMGSLLEMYDFSLYGFLAPLLAPLFFPAHHRYTSFLATFAVFAVGYLMRPLGSFIYGHFGDRLGRKKTLIYSILMMAIPTFLIALLPTFYTIGYWAPIGLLIVRMIQGIAVGGEFSGATLFLAEHARSHRRGFLCSLVFFGINAGILLAAAVNAMLASNFDPTEMADWGWRVAFAVGLIVAFVAYFIRKRVNETPIFMDLKIHHNIQKAPLFEVFHKHFGKIVKGACITWVASVIVGLLFMYLPTYLRHQVHLSFAHSMQVGTTIMVVVIIFISFMGFLSDQFGRKPIFLLGCLGIAIFSFPFFHLMKFGHHFWIYFSVFFFALFASAILGTIGAILSELFPTPVRFSGFSIAYNIAFALFAGTSPLIAMGLIHFTGHSTAPAYYLIFSSILSILVVYSIGETARKPLI